MSTVSTAPLFKAALIEALAARPGLSGVQVQATYPGIDLLRPQAMYYGKAAAKIGTPVISGPRIKRQEEYDLEVVIDVCDGGRDVTKPEGVAFALMGELDDQLSSNTTEGVAVIYAHISMWEEHPFEDMRRNGWAVLLKVTVAVVARLQ